MEQLHIVVTSEISLDLEAGLELICIHYLSISKNSWKIFHDSRIKIKKGGGGGQGGVKDLVMHMADLSLILGTTLSLTYQGENNPQAQN